MRIGFFTETYLPATDGIAQSIELFRQELEKLGHQVYVFAPKISNKTFTEPSERIIRIPAIKSPFDNRMAGAYFPPAEVRRVEKLDLDLIHFHYPAPVGLLGAYVATKNNIPLVTTWHTDLFEYVRHYPAALPAFIALAMVAPIMVNGNIKDFQTALSTMRPEYKIERWNQKIVRQIATLINNKADLIIAPSRKIQNQLISWGTTAPLVVLPTGVDKITTNAKQIASVRALYGIMPSEQVITFVGRLGPEKNIELLLRSFQIITQNRPKTRLLLVGDHKRLSDFKHLAVELGIGEHIIYTGYVDHNNLGGYYGATDVFAFPSVMDTQGLVLSEAAHAGLPIVMVDAEITEIMVNGLNGLIAEPSPESFAAKILELLEDPERRKQLGKAGQILAAKYTASLQAAKLIDLYGAAQAHHALKLQPFTHKGL